MGDFRIGQILKQLIAQRGADRTSSETSDRALERKRIRSQLVALRGDIQDRFPELDIRPLVLLVKQGISITDVYKSGDLFTVDIVRADGTTGQVFQEIGALHGEVLVHSDDRYGEDTTVKVQRSGRQIKFVEESFSSRKTYTSSGQLDTHEEDGALHKFKKGKLLYSEDLATGRKSFYYEGTDRVAFIEQPDGTVLKKDIFAFEENRQFQVELQPTKYKLEQDRRKLIAKPKLHVRRRLRAYRRKIKARVKEARISGRFKDAPLVSYTSKSGQVAVAAGMVLVAKPQALKMPAVMFGLSESLVAAFLRTGLAFGSSAVVSSKPSVVDGTTKVANVVDDAAAVRADAHLPLILMSEGAVSAVIARNDSSHVARDGSAVRREGRDPAKSTKSIKADVLQASYKETAGVGAPVVLSERGAIPTVFGERYVAPRRAAHMLDLRISTGAGRQSSLFKGSVLSVVQGSQWGSSAAWPVAKAVAPIEAKVSVRETMREMLVKKTDRGSRDSGGGSNSQQGSDDGRKKKQQSNQADS